MRLPRSIRQSLSVRVIQPLTFGFLLLCVGVVPLAAAKPSQLVYNDSDVKFGTVVVGQTATLPVTVTNSGETSVTISGMALSNSGFSTSPVTLPLVLQAGQSFSMNVSFVPPALGWTGGTIKFATDGSAAAAIQVEGTGVSAEALSASPAAVSFGQVGIGSTTSVPVVLTNLKHWKVTLQAMTVTGAGFSREWRYVADGAGRGTKRYGERRFHAAVGWSSRR